MYIGTNTYTNPQKTSYINGLNISRQSINCKELKEETKLNQNSLPVGLYSTNISFSGGKRSVIYAIDRDGNYQKFKNQTEAAKALNIYQAQISAVISDK